ncbi:hypothetical protein [Fimbriimonas ginsengisoli]|uniref:Adhesin domain-containing protein n=1 Tax=Fimbriimonas ginsengisoli Gsoil 348 TaxID=661478 RepID=A0A068NPS7_FIMGI|nr:hypothetical protein [Fimbriimonas ginsengisoli]AIE85387.1 hypothetical protein OP10G_2019 [Fimbriimonas ginsengisoli Gsoil 348]
MLKSTYFVLTTALLGATGVAATLQTSHRNLRQERGQEPRESRTINGAVTGGDARVLRIDVPFGTLHLLTSRSNELKVHAVRSAKKPLSAEARRWLDQSVLTVSRNGNVLTVKDQPPTGFLEKGNSKGADIDLEIEISAPAGLDVDLQLKYGSADGGGQFGAFKGVVGAGEVDLHPISCGGALDLHVGAGQISLGLESPLRRDSKLWSGAGEITIDLPKNTNADVSAEVGVGDIEGVPATSRSDGEIKIGGKRRTRFGQGGPKLDIHVGAGSIQISRGGKTFGDELQASMEAEPTVDFSPADVTPDQDDEKPGQIDREIAKALKEASAESERAMAEAEREIKRAMAEVDRAMAEARREIRSEHLGPDIEAIVRSAMKTARGASDQALREVRRSLKRITSKP